MMLNLSTCRVRLHTLLHAVACCWELLHKVWNRSKFWVNNSQQFFCSVITEAWLFAQLFQHCWAHARALHTVSLEKATQLLRVMGQHCVHPLAHHCQHGHNNSQHVGPAMRELLDLLWFNFILGSNYISPCFKLFTIYYHTPKQREIKFKPRIKLNHNIFHIRLHIA